MLFLRRRGLVPVCELQAGVVQVCLEISVVVEPESRVRDGAVVVACGAWTGDEGV